MKRKDNVFGTGKFLYDDGNRSIKTNLSPEVLAENICIQFEIN